jgi:hypothetical protein
MARRSVRGALAALLVTLAVVLIAHSNAAAQRPLVDPRAVSLGPADLPRGFTVVERETALEQLRTGQSGSDADVVGVSFKTAMERPRTLENLQSGPVRVGQIIARSDDPSRATFALDAQREFNVREHGYEVAEASPAGDDILCLVRRDGPFVEYRIAAIKNGDTLVSTTTVGLPSAVHLDGAIALTRLSLARYDEQSASLVAAQQPQAADARSINPEVRAVATATPTPAPAPPPAVTAPPPVTPTAQPTAQTAKAKLPAHFDDRLAQPWSELMSSTATTKSGEKVPAFLRRVVEETDLEVSVGNLGPNVGGEHRSVTRSEGDRAKIIESEITLNNSVMSESPRVLAAMLAHEITHANQPIRRSGGKLMDCVEDEVEAYGVQARVWAAYWGQSISPGGTRWERTMNYIAEVWQDSGDDGLRQLIREETGTSSHSCIE